MNPELAGYRLRPHNPTDPGDVDAVTELIAAVERAVLGEQLISRSDVAAEWSVETFRPELHSMGMYEDDRLVASCEIYNHRTYVSVHPTATGRGLGTWLRQWSEDRARQLGRDAISQVVPEQDEAAVRILRAAGYQPRYTSWVIRKNHAEQPDEAEPPEGVLIRHFRPGDERAAYDVIESAFGEWPGREPSPFEYWRATTVDRDDFVAADFLLAERDGAVVGAAFLVDEGTEVWVDQLAVVPEQRGQGIARALLREAFRRSYQRGYATTGLSTDSRTGALTLYEKIGMTVRMAFTRYELSLLIP